MRLLGIASAILLNLPGEYRAQALPIRAGDTVRVWYPQRMQPSPSLILTSLAGDTLSLGQDRVRATDLTRIDVARGSTVPRSRAAAFVGTGLVAGVAAGLLVMDRGCRSCDTIYNFIQLGASVGAGAGYLASRLFKTPRWYTVWPQSRESQVEVPRERDTTQVATPGHFLGVRPGQDMHFWTAEPVMQSGRFAELTSDSSGLLLVGRVTPIPLSSLDAFEVGRRQTTRGAVLGAVAFGGPVLLIAPLLCVLSFSDCEAEDVLVVVGAASFIGFGVGAAIGSTRITWQLRFSR